MFNNTNGTSYTLAIPASGASGLTLNNSGSGVTVSDTANGPQLIFVGLTLADAGGTTFNIGPSSSLSLQGQVGESSSGRTLTKTGSGTLILGNTNTYSGGTTLGDSAGDNGGTTIITSGDGNLGNASGPLTINNATLDGTYSGSASTSRSISVNNNAATIKLEANASLSVLSGIGGTGGLTVNASNTNSTGLTLFGANSYPGPTTVLAGTLTLDGSASLASGTVNVDNGGTLNVGFVSSNTAALNGTTLNVHNGAAASVVLDSSINSTAVTVDAGGTLTVNGGLTSSANLTANGTVTFANGAQTLATLTDDGSASGQLTLSNGTTLTINGSGASSYSGYLTDNVVNNHGGPQGSLIKSGSGTLTLSGVNNDYTGGTTISGGTLLATNVSGGSATGSGAVTVQTGGTLGGGGQIGGPVTVATNGSAGSANNGHLSPSAGLSAATLTINSTLVLSNHSYLDFDLNSANVSAGSGGNDLVNVPGDNGGDGNLTINPNLTLTITPGVSFGNGLYHLITYTGTLSDNSSTFSGWTVAGSGLGSHIYTFSSNSGEIDLTVAPVTVALLTWTGQTGGSGAANSNWTTSNTDTNWANGAVASAYQDGVPVSFGDTNAAHGNAAVTNGTVTVQATGVEPSSVTFNNSSVTYSLSNASGTVGISGSTSVTVQGGGTVNFNSPNSYTGGTSVTSGTLATTAAGALGSGSLTVSTAAGAISSVSLGTSRNGDQPVGHGQRRRLRSQPEHRLQRQPERESIDQHLVRGRADRLGHLDQVVERRAGAGRRPDVQ